MGSANSHIINIINGSRYALYVGLNGKSFEYRREGAGELKRSISVYVANGSYVQIYPALKYVEMTIECKDHEDREVKHLRFFTRDDFSWIVRNFGVARQKPGILGLVVDEDYITETNTSFQDERSNWKYDHGEKIKFYYWDVDRENMYAQQDREDRGILAAMREAEKVYGESKNWAVLADSFHQKALIKPNVNQRRIGFEFIAACQIYTASMTNKVPLVWLIQLNVESLKKEKDLGGWRIEIVGIDNVNDNLQFERIILGKDQNFFAMIHIQRGPIFSIHRIQECFCDSMINQTEVWVADPALDLRLLDRGNRNFRLFNDAHCCKCWIQVKKK